MNEDLKAWRQLVMVCDSHGQN